MAQQDPIPFQPAFEARVQEAFDDYVRLKLTAEQTLWLPDAMAAAQAWARFLRLFESPIVAESAVVPFERRA